MIDKTSDLVNDDTPIEDAIAVNDLEFNCPHCQTAVTAPPELAGATATCPQCDSDFTVPSRKPPDLPPSANVVNPKRSNGVIRAGWICFGLGAGFAVMLFLIPIWAMLFAAAIILGIVATSQRENGGLALLLCSIFVPPVLALFMATVLFVGSCGLIATGVQKELSQGAPAKPKRAAASPATKPPQALRVVDFGAQLCQLDALAQDVEKAPTTILKDDAMTRFRKEGKALFTGTEMVLQAKVKDVKMLGEEKAELTFSGVDLGAYARQADKAMLLNPAKRHVKIPMTAAQARQLRPGQLLTLRVAPSLVPRGRDGIIGMAHSAHADLFSVTVKGRPPSIGYDAGIRIRVLAYSIEGGNQ